jgi:hypothetical protein
MTDHPYYLVVNFTVEELDDPQAMERIAGLLATDPDRAVAMYITNKPFDPITRETPREEAIKRIKEMHQDAVMHCGLRFNSQSGTYSITDLAFSSFHLGLPYDDGYGCVELRYAVTAANILSAVYEATLFQGRLYAGEYNLSERWRGQPAEPKLLPESSDHPYRVYELTWTSDVQVGEALANIQLLLSGGSSDLDMAQLAFETVLSEYNEDSLYQRLTKVPWFV